MLLTILLLLSLLYMAMFFVCAIAAGFGSPSVRTFRPTVAIIIAARNEEHNISRCLTSMTRLSYPLHLLEVVVVDDRSTDATQDIVDGFARQYPHIRLVVAAPETGNLRGKTNAVTQGIEASSGEVLLFTDADCVVPQGWVEETLKYYVDEKVGVVAGFTSLGGGGWFSAMQALDWYALFSVAAAANRLGFPVTAVGNNLSVRRTAYDRVGGYRQIPFSVTEDYALFHSIIAKTDFAATFPMDPATTIESAPCRTWKDLYSQKKRWFTGGRDMELNSLLIFGLAYVYHILLVAGLVFDGRWVIWEAFLMKILADFVLILPAVVRFRRWRLLRAFPMYELYFIAYVVVYPLIVLFGRKVIWKERTFRD